MKGAALCTALLVTPMDASALSCLEPDPLRSFKLAEAAEQPHIVVHGRFAFDAARLPKAGEVSDDTIQIPAAFSGKGLTPDGFTVDLRLPVSIDVWCVSGWCGQMAADPRPRLAFLEQRGDAFHLVLGPCPQNVFADPTRAVLDQMVACIASRPCAPAD